MRTKLLLPGILVLLFSQILWADDTGLGDLPTDVDAAKGHFREGMRYFDAKRYDDAVREFRVAYEIKPTWKLQYNIGQAEAAAKRYGLALEEFEAYLGKGGDEVVLEREKDVLREIDRLRMLVGVLDVRAPMETDIYVDGNYRATAPLRGVLRVAVGEHRVEMVLDKQIIYEGKVKIAGAVRTVLDVTSKKSAPGIATYSIDMPKSEPAAAALETAITSTSPTVAHNIAAPKKNRMSRQDKLFLISGAGAAAIGLGALGAGIGFTLAASQAAEKRDRYETEYNNSDEKDETVADLAIAEQNEVDRNSRFMAGCYVVGGLVGAAGAVLLTLFFRNWKAEKVAVVPTSNGIGITF